MCSLSSAAVTCWVAWSATSGRGTVPAGATDPTNQTNRKATSRDSIADLKVYLTEAPGATSAERVRRMHMTHTVARLILCGWCMSGCATGRRRVVAGVPTEDDEHQSASV